MLLERLENCYLKYFDIICEIKEFVYLFSSFGTARMNTLSYLAISGPEAKATCHLLTAYYSLRNVKSPSNYCKHYWYAKYCKREKKLEDLKKIKQLSEGLNINTVEDDFSKWKIHMKITE